MEPEGRPASQPGFLTGLRHLPEPVPAAEDEATLNGAAATQIGPTQGRVPLSVVIEVRHGRPPARQDCDLTFQRLATAAEGHYARRVFVQRDILMLQIEAIAHAIARHLGTPAEQLVDEAACEAAAGMSLDVAAAVPPGTVLKMLEDSGEPEARALVLGLGLAARALRGGAPRSTAHALIEGALTLRPELRDAQVEAVLRALEAD